MPFSDELLESSLTTSFENINDSVGNAELYVIALANRSYHLPGYGWCQDFSQYMSNNHPLFGIFCHHPLHPINTKWRLLIFLGSILSGLTISNIFFFLVLNDESYQETLFQFTFLGQEWYITSGLVMLWTVGGSIHALFDITIWYITACSCCYFSNKKHRCQNYGHIFVVFIMILLVALGSLLVLVRASIENHESFNVYDLDSAGLVDDLVTYSDISKEDVHFLLGYILEFTFALTIYYPMASLVLFSGILGCGGRIPILGGRPRDIYLLKQRLQQEAGKNMDGDDDNATMYSF